MGMQYPQGVAGMNPSYPSQASKHPSSVIETRSAEMRVEGFKLDRPQAAVTGLAISFAPGTRYCAEGLGAVRDPPRV